MATLLFASLSEHLVATRTPCLAVSHNKLDFQWSEADMEMYVLRLNHQCVYHL